MLALSENAAAHPTIYRDGFVFDSMNSKDDSSLNLHYSLHPRFSLGVHGLRENQKDRDFYTLTSYSGIRLWRKNAENYQANAYAYGGVGATRQSNSTQPAFYAGAQADIEDRRWLLMGKFESMQFRKFRDLYTSTLRLAFAPYEGQAGEIHSWIIGQYDYQPHEPKAHDVSALMRFFYKNILLEAGSSFRGHWKLNLMFHY
jgi:hypothetical protein